MKRTTEELIHQLLNNLILIGEVSTQLIARTTKPTNKRKGKAGPKSKQGRTNISNAQKKRWRKYRNGK